MKKTRTPGDVQKPVSAAEPDDTEMCGNDADEQLYHKREQESPPAQQGYR